MKSVAKLLVVFSAVGAFACTGGEITRDGEPLEGVSVQIWTCSEKPAFETHTNEGGLYLFNPYQANSPDLDESQRVPAGPIAFSLHDYNGGFAFHRRLHAYDEECSIPYDGSTQSLPCKRHDIEFDPMGVEEYFAEVNAFLLDDCP
ncbi:MAG: hypothetical protein AAFQ65_14460 [Myxococcota bacterium]